MKILLLTFIFISSLLANIGQIVALKGEVKISRENQIISAKVGEILLKNDILNSSKNSKAQIVMKDETIITIGENSQLNIIDYVFDEKDSKNSKANFGFFKGSFKSITGSIGKLNKDRFKLKTKSASIGIRGTTVVGNQEFIACTDGAIVVTSNGVSVPVAKQQITKTQTGKPPTPAAPLTKESLNSLNESLGEKDSSQKEEAKEEKTKEESKEETKQEKTTSETKESSQEPVKQEETALIEPQEEQVQTEQVSTVEPQSVVENSDVAEAVGSVVKSTIETENKQVVEESINEQIIENDEDKIADNTQSSTEDTTNSSNDDKVADNTQSSTEDTTNSSNDDKVADNTQSSTEDTTNSSNDDKVADNTQSSTEDTTNSNETTTNNDTLKTNLMKFKEFYSSSSDDKIFGSKNSDFKDGGLTLEDSSYFTNLDNFKVDISSTNGVLNTKGYIKSYEDTIGGIDDETSYGEWFYVTTNSQTNSQVKENYGYWVSGIETPQEVIQSVFSTQYIAVNFQGKLFGYAYDNAIKEQSKILDDGNNNISLTFSKYTGKSVQIQEIINFNVDVGNDGSATNDYIFNSSNIIDANVSGANYSSKDKVTGTLNGGETYKTRTFSGDLNGTFYGSDNVKAVGGELSGSAGNVKVNAVYKANNTQK